MADIETEIQERMVADHATMIHAREHMKAMATKRILASCEDTRWDETLLCSSCGGFFEYSIFSSLQG